MPNHVRVDRGEVDVAGLGVEPDTITATNDHFCPRCDCFRSGYADAPNPTTEWCSDVTCSCHDEDR